MLQIARQAAKEQAALAYKLYKDDGIGTVMIAVWLVRSPPPYHSEPCLSRDQIPVCETRRLIFFTC